MNKLLINEGIQTQREGESLRYKITTTPWASNPTSVTIEVWDITNPTAEVDVTNTVTTGATAVSSDEITCKNLYNLTEGKKYRMDVSFISANNTWVVPVIVKCVR